MTHTTNTDFDRFWSAYPRKVAKKYCWKCWQKLKPNEDLVAFILAAVEQQKLYGALHKSRGQYIPHPSTWLNDERWDDEVVAPQEEESMADRLERLDREGKINVER